MTEADDDTSDTAFAVQVRLKPDATYEQVRLKSDATYEKHGSGLSVYAVDHVSGPCFAVVQRVCAASCRSASPVTRKIVQSRIGCAPSFL
jgi:hypothetical protein